MAPSAVAVMGVLNVTPDSFSDGGHHLEATGALARARVMLAEGARFIDVGGESTRPGAAPVDPTDEQARVLPVIEAIAEEALAAGAEVSIDTRNPSTARAAVAAGATIINDVSASLWPVAAELGVTWVAMHMHGDPRTMQRDPHYDDVVTVVHDFLADRARAALAAGVPEVWVDPGIGFGKTARHNLELLARLDELAELGPLLVGTSRKSTLGLLLARADAGLPVDPEATVGDDVSPRPVPVDDRLEGSLSTAAWAMIHGARIIRAHDVGPTVRVATVCANAGTTTGDDGHAVETKERT